ncbi:MAG TPA: acyl carrier protein, partial [Roseiflexaceae bacterium]
RRWRQSQPRAAHAPLLADLGDSPADADAAERATPLRATLTATATCDRRDLLQNHLVDQVASVLRLPADRIDAQTPLPSIGLDSLMALELRNRLEASLGITLSATMVWGYPTIAALVPHLADRLGIDLAEQTAPVEDDHADAIVTNVVHMSEDQAEAALAETLAAIESSLA